MFEKPKKNQGAQGIYCKTKCHFSSKNANYATKVSSWEKEEKALKLQLA